MLRLAYLLLLASCAVDDSGATEEPLAGCGKRIHIWFEPTSGMDAITGDNGCWTYENMMSATDGWGWCAEINGTLQVKHAPADVVHWVFDDTNPVRTAALDDQQLHQCHAAMPKDVAGIEVMARRPDPHTGTTHWQKLIVSDASGWLVNHWIAELHASAFDVASYFEAWKADETIGRPQVNARSNGATCDARVYAAVLAVCREVKSGSQMSIVKNDGRLAFDGGCLTHVVEALNACTR